MILPCVECNYKPKKTIMLYTIAMVLLILWLLGVVGVYTIGGNLIHILLVVAIVVVLLRVISGRKPM